MRKQFPNQVKFLAVVSLFVGLLFPGSQRIAAAPIQQTSGNNGKSVSGISAITAKAPALPQASYVDTTFSDFDQNCASLADTHVTDIGGGAVELAASFADDFNGTSLDTSKWSTGTWSPPPTNTFTTTLANSIITLPGGGYVGSNITYTHGTFEAIAEFGQGTYQHLGFASYEFMGNRYLIFSTKNTTDTLYARVNNNSNEQAISLGSIPTGYHRYRVDWSAVDASTDQVLFYIDGITQTVPLTITIDVATDFYAYLSNNGAADLNVDSAQVAPPYLTNGSYTSCPLDAGIDNSWQSIAWDTSIPTNTSVTVQERTSFDKVSWSDWNTVTVSGSPVSSPARYLQYHLLLGTTDPSITPLVNSVTLDYGKGQIAFSKTDSGLTQATIGQVIPYTLSVTVPQTSTRSLVITDTLPAGLVYVDASETVNGISTTPSFTVSPPNDGSAPVDLVWDFGPGDAVFSSQQATIGLNAIVADVVGVQSGDVLTNTAVLSYRDSADVLQPPLNGSDDFTVVEPHLVVSKTISLSQASPNDVVTTTIQVENTGTSTAYDVILEDPLPETKFSDYTSVSTPSGYGFTTQTSAGTTKVLYSGGSIDAGQKQTFAFTAKLTDNVVDGEVITDTATVTQATTLPGPDPNERDEPAVSSNEASLTVVRPDIRLSKTDGVSLAAPGQTLVYTLTVTNDGLGAADNVVVSDTLPVGTSFVSASNGGVNASGVVSWGAFNLASGAGVDRTLTVQVDDPLGAGITEIRNTAQAHDDGAHGTDPTPANNIAEDVDLAESGVDLQLSKTDGGATVEPGGGIVYTLSYTNAGNQGATGVVITETLPANTSFDAAGSTNGWDCLGSSCTFAVGALSGGGASGNVDFAVTVVNPLPAGVVQISNTAVIGDDGSSGADLVPENNTAQDTTPVTAVSDLQLSKTDGGATREPGGVIVYTLSYANVGNQGATGVVITETLPANTSFNAAVSSSGWNCVGSSCTFAVGALNGGGVNGSVNFAVTVADPLPEGVTQISNTAMIGDDGSNGADPTPEDNQATISTSIQFQKYIYLPVLLKVAEQ